MAHNDDNLRCLDTHLLLGARGVQVSFFHWGELEPPIDTFERRYFRPLVILAVLLGVAVAVVCTHVAAHERALRALRVNSRKKQQ